MTTQPPEDNLKEAAGFAAGGAAEEQEQVPYWEEWV